MIHMSSSIQGRVVPPLCLAGIGNGAKSPRYQSAVSTALASIQPSPSEQFSPRTCQINEEINCKSKFRRFKESPKNKEEDKEKEESKETECISPKTPLKMKSSSPHSPFFLSHALHKLTPRSQRSSGSSSTDLASSPETLMELKKTRPNTIDYAISRIVPLALLRNFVPAATTIFKEMLIGQFSISTGSIHSNSYFFRAENDNFLNSIYSRLMKEEASDSFKIEENLLEDLLKTQSLWSPEERQLFVSPYFIKIFHLLYRFAEMTNPNIGFKESLLGREALLELVFDAKKIVQNLKIEEATLECLLYYYMSKEIANALRKDPFHSSFAEEDMSPSRLLEAISSEVHLLEENRLYPLSEDSIIQIIRLLQVHFDNRNLLQHFFNLLSLLQVRGADLFILLNYAKKNPEVTNINNLFIFSNGFKFFCDVIRYYQTAEKIASANFIKKKPFDQSSIYTIKNDEFLHRAISGKFCWIFETLAFLRGVFFSKETHDIEKIFYDAAHLYDHLFLRNDRPPLERLYGLAQAIKKSPLQIPDKYLSEAEKFVSLCDEMEFSESKKLRSKVIDTYQGDLNEEKYCYPLAEKWERKWIYALFVNTVPEYRLMTGWAFESWRNAERYLKSNYPQIFRGKLERDRYPLYEEKYVSDESSTETLYRFLMENEQAKVCTTRRHALYRNTHHLCHSSSSLQNSQGNPLIGYVSVTMELTISIDKIREEKELWEAKYYFNNLSFTAEANEEEFIFLEKYLSCRSNNSLIQSESIFGMELDEY